MVVAFTLLLLIAPRGFSRRTDTRFGRGSCPRPTEANIMAVMLESYDYADGLEMPNIDILEYKIVCEAPGLMRGTLSSFSVVVRYVCSGSGVKGCVFKKGERVTLTEQFDSICDASNIYQKQFGVSRRRFPMATLQTPLMVCGECIAPTRTIPSDQAHHCIGMSKANIQKTSSL